jgi:NO-binding membrane sensor protein with MHYT domain/nitrogen-specific signal transduction histidine kinase
MCISGPSGAVAYLTWDFRFVVLSVAIAIAGSFAALECAHRMKTAETPRGRRLFLLLGAGLMGLAIWTMHFIGMLALTVPMPVSYAPSWTAISILAAIVGAALAFLIMGRTKAGWFHVSTGGIAMGVAIASMHYLGMASMRMSAAINYEPTRFALSIAIAMAASAGALAIGYRMPRSERSAFWLKGGSAVVMGFAIAGMHYVGMSAARYRAATVTEAKSAEPTVGNFSLRDVVMAAGVVFGGALIAIAARAAVERERALEAHRRLAAELEQRVRERTAQLEAANRQLEAANRELSTFSYSVSHDLRAPLRSIAGFSEVLLETCESKLEDTERHYLQRIKGSVERMDALLSGLLNLAHVSRAPLQRTNVNVSELAQAIMDDLASQDPERKLEITVTPGMHAWADRSLLNSVLQNLLGNAWKFTARTANARIEFDVMERDGRPVFFIRDNGAGFKMEHANRLFGMFERLHHVSEFSGHGVGLAIVGRIIERHGGRIWAEASIGRGATFFFTLGAEITAPQKEETRTSSAPW